jgi:hypothetical protein
VGCHLKIAKTTTSRTALAILSPALANVLGIAVENGPEPSSNSQGYQLHLQHFPKC